VQPLLRTYSNRRQWLHYIVIIIYCLLLLYYYEHVIIRIVVGIIVIIAVFWLHCTCYYYYYYYYYYYIHFNDIHIYVHKKSVEDYPNQSCSLILTDSRIDIKLQHTGWLVIIHMITYYYYIFIVIIY